jgi:hypothetical protein
MRVQIRGKGEQADYWVSKGKRKKKRVQLLWQHVDKISPLHLPRTIPASDNTEQEGKKKRELEPTNQLNKQSPSHHIHLVPSIFILISRFPFPYLLSDRDFVR